MKRARVIPVLLLKGKGLYKTERFKNERYVGDPVNAVRIFNEKQCDELILLDINASKTKAPIDFKFVADITSECFMPIAYGGGISKLGEIDRLLKIGIEKVILNSVLLKNPMFLRELQRYSGAQPLLPPLM
jgi:cyclase